ncbi:hypothetical protein L1785_00450 [Antribacter sp. KLBMP9083]|uniref:DUF4232 domain-containing protein n=1 Tax=Antribacter soli TaxID=2910976 RepID=A0AA41QBC1_9MICO|nr:hypothetical protein [Antribacter soli]MCF4119451.1 hypothetical protein [Antribacter soli]
MSTARRRAQQVVGGPDRSRERTPVQMDRIGPGRRRRRVARTLVVAVLLAGGAGAVWLSWPDPEQPIVSHKVHPPEPVSLTGPADRCSADVLDVAFRTDRTSFGPGQPVTFDLTVTNTGRVPCLVDGSDANWTVTVVAGDVDSVDAGVERVWSSGDCSSDERMLLLGPKDVYSREVRWSDVRSVPGCGAGQPPLGGGTYTAQVTLGDVPAAQSPAVTITRTEPLPAPSPTDAPSGSPAPTPAPSPSGDPSPSAQPGA